MKNLSKSTTTKSTQLSNDNKSKSKKSDSSSSFVLISPKIEPKKKKDNFQEVNDKIIKTSKNLKQIEESIKLIKKQIDDNDIKKKFIEKGIIDELITILKENENNNSIQYLCIGILFDLMQDTEIKRNIYNKGVVKIVLSIAKQYQLNILAQKQTCLFIKRIINKSNLCNNIISLGGDKVIINAINNHKNDFEIVAEGCKCLKIMIIESVDSVKYGNIYIESIKRIVKTVNVDDILLIINELKQILQHQNIVDGIKIEAMEIVFMIYCKNLEDIVQSNCTEFFRILFESPMEKLSFDHIKILLNIIQMEAKNEQLIYECLKIFHKYIEDDYSRNDIIMLDIDLIIIHTIEKYLYNKDIIFECFRCLRIFINIKTDEKMLENCINKIFLIMKKNTNDIIILNYLSEGLLNIINTQPIEFIIDNSKMIIKMIHDIEKDEKIIICYLVLIHRFIEIEEIKIEMLNIGIDEIIINTINKWKHNIHIVFEGCACLKIISNNQEKETLLEYYSQQISLIMQESTNNSDILTNLTKGFIHIIGNIGKLTFKYQMESVKMIMKIIFQIEYYIDDLFKIYFDLLKTIESDENYFAEIVDFEIYNSIGKAILITSKYIRKLGSKHNFEDIWVMVDAGLIIIENNTRSKVFGAFMIDNKIYDFLNVSKNELSNMFRDNIIDNQEIRQRAKKIIDILLSLPITQKQVQLLLLLHLLDLLNKSSNKNYLHFNNNNIIIIINMVILHH